MSKHANGDLSTILYLRLRLAGGRMIRANERAQKARDKYEELYMRRYGAPTLRQLLDDYQGDGND